MCQALADQDFLERRAVKGTQDLLEFLDHLVSTSTETQDSGSVHAHLLICTLYPPGVKGEPGKGVSIAGPQGFPGPQGEQGSEGFKGEQQRQHVFIQLDSNN